MSKRIAVLILSFTTLICYGKAIKGLGGYLLGMGNPLMIVLGLSGGTLAACLAVRIWRLYLAELEEEDRNLRDKNQK